MRSRMQAQLDLTPEQIAKTAPIFDKAARELEKIRAETGQRVQQILAEADRELAPMVTAEQRARLQKIQPAGGDRKGPRHRGPRALERDASNPAVGSPRTSAPNMKQVLTTKARLTRMRP